MNIMWYGRDFSCKFGSNFVYNSAKKYTYKAKKNGHVLPKPQKAPKFSLDNWSIAEIGRLTDYIFNPFTSMSGNGNSTQDKSIRSVLPEKWKAQKDSEKEAQEYSTQPNFPFEITPWIAALSAGNAGIHKKRVAIEKRYTETIKENTKLINNVNRMDKCFGYPFIHNSLGFHYATSLVNGNQYMGTHILGELISSLNTSSSTEDSSASINLINMMIEQFAISNSIYNMDSQNAVLNELSSESIFNGLQNLDYESEFTNDLSTEITNFINQVYMTHPFSNDGVSMYLKPIASHQYLSSRTLNFFP